jgi:hypothetical protein
MRCRLLMIIGAALILAACKEAPIETSGSSDHPAPAYASPLVEQEAEQGCGSGRPADFLHQNRPGGSDYDALRCSRQGY